MSNTEQNKHTLVLHIGMPKTGTTALQSFFFSNRSMLLSQGWDDPDIYQECPSNYEYARFPSNNGCSFLYAFLEKTNVFFNRLTDCLKRHLEKNNVLISSEVLWQSYVDEIKVKWHPTCEPGMLPGIGMTISFLPVLEM